MEEVQSQQPRPGPPKEKMRPIKPEEQALMDELILLQEQYGEQFPTICSFVRKGIRSPISQQSRSMRHLAIIIVVFTIITTIVLLVMVDSGCSQKDSEVVLSTLKAC